MANGRNDQWKRGGICELCRRQSYCKTTCSAHRDHEDGKIASYFRRLASDPDIQKALKNAEGAKVE